METKAKRGIRWLTNSLMILIAGYAITNTVASVLMNRIIEEYDLVSGEQGLVSSMIQLGSVIAVLLIPLFQGRVKKTVMLSFSGLLISVTMALTGLSPNFYILLAACLFLGLGGGWTDSYINSMVADLNSKQNGTRSMGALHGWYGVGSLITPIVIQALLQFMGWRSVYYVLTGIVLATALQFIFVAQAFKDELQASGSIAEQKVSGKLLKEYFSDGYNILLVLSGMMYTSGQNCLTGWVVRYMAITFDAEALGALCITLMWVGVTLSRFISPYLKIAPLKLLGGGLLLTGIAHATGLLSNSPIVLVVMVALTGLTSGACMPMIIHESVSRYPGNTSLPTSVIMIATKLPMMIVPILVGVVAAATSLKTAMLIGAGFSIIGSLISFTAFRVKKRRGL